MVLGLGFGLGLGVRLGLAVSLLFHCLAVPGAAGNDESNFLCS